MPAAPLVFFGSDSIALPLLDRLLTDSREANAAFQLAGVVSQPDRPGGRGKKLRPNPVAAWALENKVDLWTPEIPDDATLAWVRERSASVGLVMAYGHFLRKALREAFPRGMVNFHGSLLPDLRGASPVETAIALGYRETGVCLMQVVGKMDAGAVAARERVPIAADANAADVRSLIAGASARLWADNARALAEDSLEWIPQPPEGVTYCRKLTKADGNLDFHAPATALAARLRGLYPWPGCGFDFNELRIKVVGAEAENSETKEPPGTVLEPAPDALRIAAGTGVLRIFNLQRPGSRMLAAADFLRGFPIPPGTQLESVVMTPLIQ